MKRVLTALVGIPIVIVITIFAPNWLFALVVGLVAMGALEEFLKLGAAAGLVRPGKWFLFFGLLVTVSFGRDLPLVIVATTLATLALLTSAIFRRPIETAFHRIAIGLSGLVYCCLLLGFILMLTRSAIIVLFVLIWVGDSAAYYGGRKFGRHRLAPAVSPGKTVEGAIAGLIGSIVAGAAMSHWLTDEPWLGMAVVSGITAVAGQFGDLAESALKRSAKVKDSSSILPGHGGILDRLDSLMFAAPVFYLFSWLFH
jgi:phosphatidate cytidylyltransferase